MTKTKNKGRQLTEIILIAVIILCVGLVIVEMTTNLSNELATQAQTTKIVEEEKPTAVPTLTEQERRDLLSEPVGEEGLD